MAKYFSINTAVTKLVKEKIEVNETIEGDEGIDAIDEGIEAIEGVEGNEGNVSYLVTTYIRTVLSY